MACNYCKTDLYVKVKIYSKPLFPPLTVEEELRQKLQELTGEEFLKIQPEFCPMCGEKKE